jgi:hypothetical protein
MGAETSAVVAMKGLSYDPFGPNAWVAQANTNTSQAESDTAPGSGNAKGHFISNRVAVNSVTTALFDTGGPYNCSAGGCTTNASAFGVPNANFYLLGDNVSGTLSNASGDAISLASAGGGLSSTVKTQFAARANQLMIDIGAPYHY